MKKKAYISPAVNIHTVNVKDGIMLSLSGTTGSSNEATMESKGTGDWSNIWGGGSNAAPTAPAQDNFWQ